MKNNIIKKLYPLTKLYITFLIMLATLIIPGIISKIIIFILLNLLAVFSGEWKLFVTRVSKSILILFLILLIIQTLFYPGEEIIFELWIFKAKYEGLIRALNLGFILLNIGGSLIWFFVVTTEKDFIFSLQKSGMSSSSSYVILSTLQMVPALKKKSDTIMNAQKARGLETEGNLLTRAKVFVPIIIPLVLSSITGTEERALTLEARGFLSKEKPSFLKEVEKGKNDKIANIIVSVFIIILIVWRILTWLI